MIGALRRYIENGIPPGSFLMAVLRNDLSSAVRSADDINKYRIADYIIFLSNYAPSGCYGSPDKVREWMAVGGLGWKDVA